MMSATEGATRGTSAVGPNQEVNDGDGIKLGGHNFRFHHFGIAHSSSDLMISVPEEHGGKE